MVQRVRRNSNCRSSSVSSAGGASRGALRRRGGGIGRSPGVSSASCALRGALCRRGGGIGRSPGVSSAASRGAHRLRGGGMGAGVSGVSARTEAVHVGLWCNSPRQKQTNEALHSAVLVNKRLGGLFSARGALRRRGGGIGRSPGVSSAALRRALRRRGGSRSPGFSSVWAPSPIVFGAGPRWAARAEMAGAEPRWAAGGPAVGRRGFAEPGAGPALCCLVGPLSGPRIGLWCNIPRSNQTSELLQCVIHRALRWVCPVSVSL